MQSRWAPLVLLVLAAAVLFTGLDALPLTDQREARDAQVARELIARKDVLTPRLDGAAHFEKPLAAYAPEAWIALESRTGWRESSAIHASGA